jgi:hypothetical protein
LFLPVPFALGFVSFEVVVSLNWLFVTATSRNTKQTIFVV